MQVRLLLAVLGGMIPLTTARGPKWFIPRETVTQIVRQQHTETQVVPSSCVVVEPSLKSCKNVRSLNPSPLPEEVIPPKIPMTATPRLESGVRGDTSGGWTSYLGLEPVTVSHTLTKTVTDRSTMTDVVVTFSVRGCRPSHLPLDLTLCPTATTTVKQTASTVKDIHFAQEST